MPGTSVRSQLIRIGAGLASAQPPPWVPGIHASIFLWIKEDDNGFDMVTFHHVTFDEIGTFCPLLLGAIEGMVDAP